MKYFIALFILLFSLPSWSRPEFAARYKISRCTACHISPVGGSLRNLNGKLFAANAKGFDFLPQDLQKKLSLDLRMIYFRPENPEASGARGGLGIMSTNVGTHLSLDQNKQRQIDAVISYDLGSFNAAARDTYLLWSNSENGWYEHLLVGKFNSPFGLLSDEHRTYTKIQTKSSFNDFDTGILISGQLFNPQVHYDLGGLSGVKSNGSFTSNNNSGSVLNIRWTLPFAPLVLGASSFYYDIYNNSDPRAFSAYAIFSLDDLTNYYFMGSIQAEVVQARYLNSLSGSRVSQYFIGTDTAYESAVENAWSKGLYVLFNWDLTPKFTLQYKLDSLALNKDFDGDRFERHGVGFRHAIARQVYLMARHEFTSVGRTQALSSLLGSQKASWVLLQAWY